MIHLPPPPVSRLVGFVLKSVERGHAVFEMEADERHHNPMGTVHGGIYCDLADAAMGFAYAATTIRRMRKQVTRIASVLTLRAQPTLPVLEVTRGYP